MRGAADVLVDHKPRLKRTWPAFLLFSFLVSLALGKRLPGKMAPSESRAEMHTLTHLDSQTAISDPFGENQRRGGNLMSNEPGIEETMQESGPTISSENTRSRWKIFLTMIALSVRPLHSIPLKALNQMDREMGRMEITDFGYSSACSSQLLTKPLWPLRRPRFLLSCTRERATSGSEVPISSPMPPARTSGPTSLTYGVASRSS